MRRSRRRAGMRIPGRSARSARRRTVAAKARDCLAAARPAQGDSVWWSLCWLLDRLPVDVVWSAPSDDLRAYGPVFFEDADVDFAHQWQRIISPVCRSVGL